MKRKIIALTMSALLIGMCVVGVGASKPSSPDVHFGTGRPVGTTDGYHEDLIGISGSDISDEQRVQFDAIMDSAELASQEYLSLPKPYDIKTVMYVEDGQTILKYVGSYGIGTADEGVYFKEFVFDFVLVKDIDIGRGNDVIATPTSDEYFEQTAKTIAEIEDYIHENQ